MLFLILWHTEDVEYGFQPICLVVEMHLIPVHLVGKEVHKNSST